MVFKTTDDIIDALGGTNAVAALTQRKAQQVSFWRISGHFPAATYLIMSQALDRRGLSAPASLWGMTETPESADGESLSS